MSLRRLYRAHHDLGVLFREAPRLRGMAALRACKCSRRHYACESCDTCSLDLPCWQSLAIIALLFVVAAVLASLRSLP